MKKLTKNELKKIIYNCRKATFLIEKKLIDKITIREKIELKIHLLGCSICRLFEKQSIQINHIVKTINLATNNIEPVLDIRFKMELQEKIENKLKT